MSQVTDIFNGLLDDVKSLAGDTAKDFLKQTTVDSQQFTAQAEANIQRWRTQLTNGDIDKEDFESLLRGQLAEATLAALLKAGIAQKKAGEITDKVIDLAISAAFKILL